MAVHPVEVRGMAKGSRRPATSASVRGPGSRGAAYAPGIVQGKVHLTHLFAGTGQHGTRYQGDLAAGGQAVIGQALVMERISEPGHHAPGHGFELGAIASGQMLLELGGRFAEVQPRRRREAKGQGSQGNHPAGRGFGTRVPARRR